MLNQASVRRNKRFIYNLMWNEENRALISCLLKFEIQISRNRWIKSKADNN